MGNPTRLAAIALLAGLIPAACIPIDGGAVEISWVVRSADGRAITDCGCSDPPIARVRLHLVGRGGAIQDTRPCDGRSQCEFSCQRQTGSTPFDIKETQPGESYDVSVVAVGNDGLDLTGVTTPAPISRAVTRGQPTEVEAFLLVTQCASACLNQSGVCTRP
jgi:hypothetical protein